MDVLRVKKEYAIAAYNAATCSDIKNAAENALGKHNLVSPDVCDKITCIQDVFKELGEDYNAFLNKWKDLDEDDLNYKLLKKGIAYLNQGWKYEYKGVFWANWWNVSGSGFVLHDDHCFHLDAYAAVGAALRCKNQKIAQHAAKVFLPQYKGHYKPSEV